MKQTLQACVFDWIVLCAAHGFGGLAGRILASAAMRYIGRVSCGVYLAHGFAAAMALGLFSAIGLAWPIPEPWRFIVLCGVTLGAAALSWSLVERPLIGFKRAFPYTDARQHESRNENSSLPGSVIQ